MVLPAVRGMFKAAKEAPRLLPTLPAAERPGMPRCCQAPHKTKPNVKTGASKEQTEKRG